MKKYQVLPVVINPGDEVRVEKKPIVGKTLGDTYVIDGDAVSGPDALKDSNFGDSTVLHFKGDSHSGTLYRRVLLKFDISSFVNVDFLRVVIKLLSVACQEMNECTPAYIYEMDENAWDANTVTYNNLPAAGKLIKTVMVGMGDNRIDVTDYVREKLAEGKTTISVMMVGDDKNPLHVQFASSRHAVGQGPKIEAAFSLESFHPNIAANDGIAKVWDHAAKMVEEWVNDWDDILARGDFKAETVVEKDCEYAKQVDVTMNPHAPFAKKRTRTLDTIEGYEPVKDGEIVYDEFGGCVCDKKFNATGWFHIEERDGRLWSVSPLGNPFYRLAMVLLAPGASPNQREKMLKKYGSLENWTEIETAHMRDDLGYNSLGGWSATDLLAKAKQPLALSHIVYFLSEYTRQSGMNNSTGGNTTFVGGVMPVFDPNFESFSDERAKKVVAPYANDNHVYGWMSDNELHAETKLLDFYLTADTDNPWFAYSYATAWTFLRTVTGNENATLDDITAEHRKLFRAMIYNRYLKVVSSAVKKYAPNHMFLGCRFLPGCYRDEYVHRTAGKWCDVISLNYYGAWAPESELIHNIQKWSGTPFIITEWYAKGMDACTPESRLTNETGAGFTVKTQKERGYFYHNYTLKLMECKGCTGFDWFQCWDNDPDNLHADLSNRNANKGIYDNDCNEYTELTDAMREVNKNCYKLIEFFDNDKTRSN